MLLKLSRVPSSPASKEVARPKVAPRKAIQNIPERSCKPWLDLQLRRLSGLR